MCPTTKKSFSADNILCDRQSVDFATKTPSPLGSYCTLQTCCFESFRRSFWWRQSHPTKRFDYMLSIDEQEAGNGSCSKGYLSLSGRVGSRRKPKIISANFLKNRLWSDLQEKITCQRMLPHMWWWIITNKKPTIKRACRSFVVGSTLPHARFRKTAIGLTIVCKNNQQW